MSKLKKAVKRYKYKMFSAHRDIFCLKTEDKWEVTAMDREHQAVELETGLTQVRAELLADLLNEAWKDWKNPRRVTRREDKCRDSIRFVRSMDPGRSIQ